MFGHGMHPVLYKVQPTRNLEVTTMEHVDKSEIQTDHIVTSRIFFLRRQWDPNEFCCECACEVPSRIHRELGEEDTRKRRRLEHAEE